MKPWLISAALIASVALAHAGEMTNTDHSSTGFSYTAPPGTILPGLGGTITGGTVIGTTTAHCHSDERLLIDPPGRAVCAKEVRDADWH